MAVSYSAEGSGIAASSVAPRLRGRSLLLVRIISAATAILVVGLLVAGTPAYLSYFESRCFTAACTDAPRYMPDERTLKAAGLSVAFFARYFVGLQVLFALAHVALAAFILWRIRDQLIALLGALALVTWGLAFTNIPDGLIHAHPVWWLPVSIASYIGTTSMVAFFCVFPDGRFRPKWTLWLAVGWAGFELLATFFPNAPIHPSRWPMALVVVPFAVMFGGIATVQVYRYRHALDPAHRQQTKWVVFGLVAAAAGFVGVLALGAAAGSMLVHNPPLDLAALTSIYLSLAIIPASIGIAILRYRLWDIDVIINRTLVYGTLTAVVVGLYVLVVEGLGSLLRAQGNILVSLVGVGFIAVLFAPLRDRLQRGVNHLMYGERDEPYAVLSRLGQSLESTASPDALLSTITTTIAQALKLPHAAIALNTAEGSEVVASWGEAVETPYSVPLVYQGEEIGELRLAPRARGESFTSTDERLLQDLARHVGVAARAVRLTSDLQRSRERLVTTREEERRKLRRNLHDGLGPQLASQSLTIDAISRLLRTDPDAALSLLGHLKSQSQGALADVRRLVYDLRPPALDDLGLVAALRRHAAEYSEDGVEIVVQAQELPPLPAAVELACYRIALEALTNVVRHADATECEVRLELADSLVLAVVDDGVGIPPERVSGIGLHSMRERAEELGGTLRITPRPGGGTVVRAELPLPEVEG